MTKEEALEILYKTTPTSEPWWMNKQLSWKTIHGHILEHVQSLADGSQLVDWLVVRVRQVAKNKKMKKCPKCGHEY